MVEVIVGDKEKSCVMILGNKFRSVYFLFIFQGQMDKCLIGIFWVWIMVVYKDNIKYVRFNEEFNEELLVYMNFKVFRWGFILFVLLFQVFV